MEFEAAEAAAATKLGGKVYYFCSQRCKRWFRKDPEQYLVLEPARFDGADHAGSC
jgi:YHS domain-containing protein